MLDPSRDIQVQGQGPGERESSRPAYVYVARLKAGSSPGIRAKVTHTVEAIQRQGRSCRVDIVSSGGIRSAFEFLRSVTRAREDVLIVRSDHYSMLLLAPALIAKRLMGKIIIFDVANPVRASYRETWARRESALKRLVKLSVLFLSYPAAFLPAHRIQQYGIEGRLASLGVRRKIVLVGNAVNTHLVRRRKRAPPFDGTQLIFGMAGHIAYFHGIDRFLKSMARYMDTGRGPPDCVIRLKVIGGGYEIDALKELTRDLNLSNFVEFLDEISLAELEPFFETIHVGLCNLAQYRKGVFVNSDLKSRDMAARGLPFVLAVEDPDFRHEELGAVYRVPNDESLIDLDKIRSWYASVDEGQMRELRSFAVQKLDFDAKVGPILNFAEGKLS